MSRDLIFFVPLALMSLAGCEQGRQIMGLAREQPDEFTLETRKPLQLPPANTPLPEPRPGARALHDVDPRSEAQVALGVSTQSITAPSEAERDLLQRTGALEVNDSIRTQVNREADMDRQDHHTTQTVFFWQKKKEHGKAIDPKAEYQRVHGDKHPTETMPVQENVETDLTIKGE